MGALPDFLPGYRSISDKQSGAKFEESWGEAIPAEEGLAAVEMIQRAGDAGIRAMYLVGENPALSFPDLPKVRQSLEALDFLVVQDMFMTETAQRASVVLPAAAWMEKEGSFTNFEGRCQKLGKVLEPPGESRADWEIILHLSRTMGAPMPYSSLQDIMNEMEELIPFYGGEACRAREGEMRPTEEGKSAMGARRLYKGHFPDGFGRFSAVQFVPHNGTPDPDYPLTLLTGTLLYGIESGARSSRSKRLQAFHPRAFVEISSPDAEKLGINEGDTVRVISSSGQTETAARIASTLSEGMLFMPSCFPSNPIGDLLATELDSQSKTPLIKSCAVRLERIGSHG
jgi:predicted molibdopterin-dependent oxidoreductase YjgC